VAPEKIRDTVAVEVATAGELVARIHALDVERGLDRATAVHVPEGVRTAAAAPKKIAAKVAVEIARRRHRDQLAADDRREDTRAARTEIRPRGQNLRSTHSDGWFDLIRLRKLVDHELIADGMAI